MATTASLYNASRTTRQVLKRHRKEGPSLILHLYANTFRFERQNGAFLCDSPLKNLLYFIRDQKVPVDLLDVFDEARVPFFEGCLLIEIHDHRPPAESNSSPLPTSHLSRLANLSGSSTRNDDDEHQNGSTDGASAIASTSNLTARTLGGNYGFKRRLDIAARGGHRGAGDGSVSPNVYRVVLFPTSETLWADLRTIEEVEGFGLWSDEDVLQIESRILSLTSPPLCLTPDPQATRIANVMLSATALPASYAPLPSAPLPYHRQATRKRGINSIEIEMDRSNQRRREKILRLMERGSVARADGLPGSSSHAASFSRIGFIEGWRAAKVAEANNAAMRNANGGMQALGGGSGAGGGGGSAGDASMSKDGRDEKAPPKKKKKKGKLADDEPEPDPTPPPSSPPVPRKKPSKKKSQREKEEREKAEQEAKEEAEREAAAAAAAKARDEENAKKPKKMSKKKEKELAAKREAEEAEAAAAAAAAAAAIAAQPPKRKRPPKKKPVKPEGTGAETTPKSQPATTPQAKAQTTPKKQLQPSPKHVAAVKSVPNLQQQAVQLLQQQQQQQQQQQMQLPQQQQQQLSQQQAAQQALQMAMFSQMGGNAFNMQGMPQNNAANAFQAQFGNLMSGVANGGMMGGQQNFQQQQQQQQQQLQQQQQQLQQQLALQRALQQAGLQPQANAGNAGGGGGGGIAGLGGMNLQHLQALLAMQQQHQQRQQLQQNGGAGDGSQQQQQQQQQQYNGASSGQELPVGVGLNNLPPNWGNMG